MALNIKPDNLLNEIKFIENFSSQDTRGFFYKYFNIEIAKKFDFNIDEVFFSKNKQNVIRGIHFQKNSSPISKIVFCLEGEILDFFIDLRKDSETFGQFSSKKISKTNNQSVYIPHGFGHGFSVLSKTATVGYLQMGVYNPKAETGINVQSFEFDWKIVNPIISQRDKNHPYFDKKKFNWLDD